jgi:hypothetical protein
MPPSEHAMNVPQAFASLLADGPERTLARLQSAHALASIETPEGPLSADEALTLAAALLDLGADAEAHDLVTAVCRAAHEAGAQRHAA